MIGLKIKRIREGRKFSQEDVANKLGISQNAYSKLENNQSRITVDRLKQLADVFEVPEHELLNSDTNVFNFTNNKTANANAVYEASIELYQETITHLKAEIATNREEKKRLLDMIEKLSLLAKKS